MNTRRYIKLILITMLVYLLAACAAPTSTTVEEPAGTTERPATAAAPTPTAEPAQQEATEEEGSFPVTITDHLGREVTIQERPERIITLSPGNTETLFAIGAGEQVVGVTDYDNYPPETEGIPSVGGFSSDTISIETIVSLEPDLIVAAGDIHQPVIEAMEEVGITAVAVSPLESLDAVYQSTRLLGEITGNTAGAIAVVEEMQERVAAVTEKTEGLRDEERPTVYFEIWHEPLLTAGPDTFAGELIELAGGRNIFGELDEQYPQVSVEEIVQRDPAYIIAPDTQAEELTPEKISGRPGWAGIRAVQEKEIHLIDGDMVSRPGPRLVDILEQFAVILHPELFDE